AAPSVSPRGLWPGPRSVRSPRPLSTEDLDQVPRIVLDDDVRSLVPSGWEGPVQKRHASLLQSSHRLVEVGDDDARLAQAVNPEAVLHGRRRLAQGDRVVVLDELDDQSLSLQ